MNSCIPAIVLATLSLALPAAATTSQAPDFLQALKAGKESNQDILVLVTGSSFERLGQNLQSNWSKPGGLLSRLKSSVTFCAVDVPQNPTEEQSKTFEQKHGRFSLKPPCYPCAYLLDASGRVFATIPTAQLQSLPEARMASAIDLLVERRRQRDQWNEQAKTASGSEKAQLLFKSLMVLDEGRDKGQIDELAKLNPKAAERFTTNPWGFVGKFSGNNATQVLSEIDADLAKTTITPAQRQELLAVRSGIQRRSGASLEDLAKTYDSITAADPNSELGRAAQNAKAVWAGPMTLESGWKPHHLRGSNRIRLGGRPPLNGKGEYTLEFIWSSGRDRLDISAVHLLDGSRMVVSDVHDGFAGNNVSNNVYKLNVTKVPSNPVIEIELRTIPNQDSTGRLIWRKTP